MEYNNLLLNLHWQSSGASVQPQRQPALFSSASTFDLQFGENRVAAFAPPAQAPGIQVSTIGHSPPAVSSREHRPSMSPLNSMGRTALGQEVFCTAAMVSPLSPTSIASHTQLAPGAPHGSVHHAQAPSASGQHTLIPPELPFYPPPSYLSPELGPPNHHDELSTLHVEFVQRSSSAYPNTMSQVPVMPHQLRNPPALGPSRVPLAASLASAPPRNSPSRAQHARQVSTTGMPSPPLIGQPICSPCGYDGCTVMLDDLTAGGVRRHLRAIHYPEYEWDKKQLVNCMECPERLQLANLGKHIAGVHRGWTKRTCKQCLREYSRQDALKRHRCTGPPQ
ncbi:hypothetical protein B0H21DRAFT_762200 [Amylocystis lapponica]|nr:hypothetical protein B0H21DRAFT_762200 [Amylocystis lapponica]